MSKSEDKQIAKEITIELIKKDLLHSSEFPGLKTFAEIYAKSYKEILKIISEE